MAAERGVRAWLVVAAVAVVVQELLTVYPTPGLAPHAFWGVISAVLLYRVGRRSNTARCWFLGLASFGAIVFAISLPHEGRPIVLMATYAVQVLAMVAPDIRSWTRSREREELPASASAGV